VDGGPKGRARKDSRDERFCAHFQQLSKLAVLMRHLALAALCGPESGSGHAGRPKSGPGLRRVANKRSLIVRQQQQQQQQRRRRRQQRQHQQLQMHGTPSYYADARPGSSAAPGLQSNPSAADISARRGPRAASRQTRTGAVVPRVEKRVNSPGQPAAVQAGSRPVRAKYTSARPRCSSGVRPRSPTRSVAPPRSTGVNQEPCSGWQQRAVLRSCIATVSAATRSEISLGQPARAAASPSRPTPEKRREFLRRLTPIPLLDHGRNSVRLRARDDWMTGWLDGWMAGWLDDCICRALAAGHHDVSARSTGGGQPRTPSSR
jgi:hypothetical protein